MAGAEAASVAAGGGSSSSSDAGSITSGDTGATMGGAASTSDVASVTSGGTGSGAACWRNDDCDTSEYCATPPGRCGQVGACSTRPTSCDPIESPVCGCDNTTYASRCAAEASGVNVYVAGDCSQFLTPQCGASACQAGCRPCGKHCLNTEECDIQACGGAACMFPDGLCPGEGEPMEAGGVPTLAGLCVESYTCHFDLEEDQVCGCDGETYFNPSEAMMARVAIRHDGPCP